MVDPSRQSGVRVLLVRHGESVTNTRPDRTWGRSNDSPLTDLGREQATVVGSCLSRVGFRPDAVFSSPAVRTTQTAQGALEAMGFGDRLHFDDRLQELAQGQWTGHLREQVYTPQTLAELARVGVHFAAPGGESMREVGERMLQWLTSLRAHPEDKQVLAFAHGMATRCLVGLIDGWDHERIRSTLTPNTSLTSITDLGDRWRVDFFGEQCQDVAPLL